MEKPGEIVLNPADLPNSTDIVEVGFADAITGYAITREGKIIKTQDGGNSWTIVNNMANNSRGYYDAAIFTIHADTVIVGIKNLILKTDNGGNKWDTVFYSTNFSGKTIDFVDQNTGFAVGSKYSILKTIDKGQTWTQEDLSFLNVASFTDITFISDSIGFLVGDNRKSE